MEGMLIPATLEDALARMAAAPLLPYAGGTDLRVKYKDRGGSLRRFPPGLIYIGGLAELQGVWPEEGHLSIGAATTYGQLLAHDQVPEAVKMVVRSIGSVAVRHLATLGGNIGNASPAGDSLPLLYGMNASLTLATATGQREVPIADFITGPGTTQRQPGELITRIRLENPSPLPQVSYRKLGQRSSCTIAKLSLFAAAQRHKDRLTKLRLAWGAVGPQVVRSLALEGMIMAIPISRLPEAFPAIRAHLDTLVHPIDDLRSSQAYRREIAGNLLLDFLRQL